MFNLKDKQKADIDFISKGLRKEALRLSANTYTPVPYWISLGIIELTQWVEDWNFVVDEMNRKSKG